MVAVLERIVIKRLIHSGGAAYDGGVNENRTLGMRMEEDIMSYQTRCPLVPIQPGFRWWMSDSKSKILI